MPDEQGTRGADKQHRDRRQKQARQARRLSQLRSLQEKLQEKLHHGGSLQFAPYGIIAPPTMIQINAISATPGIVLILTAQNPPRPPRGYRQELETAGHTAAFFIGQRIEPKRILRARPRYSRCQPRAIIPSTVRATPYEERFRARLALMPSQAARAWRKRRSAQAIGTRARTHHRANPGWRSLPARCPRARCQRAA